MAGPTNSDRRVSKSSTWTIYLPETPQYIRLPPAYVPYILRVSLDAGTPASKNGVFKTNFPLDGGLFERDRFAERK